MTAMVDLFAGPGGLDLAAQCLGLDVTGIERAEGACATRDAVGLRTVRGDVRDFGPADFPDATVLAGGPPCQTYTVAGTGAGRRALADVIIRAERMAAGERDTGPVLSILDDERSGLVLEPLRWALEAFDLGRPYEAIVLEQVPAVLPVWQVFAELLTDFGYSAVCGELHAEQFGVPQTRRRAVLIARRDGEAVLPVPTHRRYVKGVPRYEGDVRLRPWVAMDSVVDRGVPFEVVSNYGTDGDPQARGRRRSDEPAATVTGRISRNRLVAGDGSELPRFSCWESGRLQSFPADYSWRCPDIAQQIGDAVPPRLGAHVLAAALGMPEVSLAGALGALQ